MQRCSHEDSKEIYFAFFLNLLQIYMNFGSLKGFPGINKGIKEFKIEN
jgi:hypothetical protein